MGCCGCCKDIMRAIDGSERVFDIYDETKIIYMGKVNNNIYQKKESADEDTKKDDKKFCSKIQFR